MKRMRCPAWIPAVLMLTAPALHAGEVVYTGSAGPISLGGTASVQVPRFDESPGVLRVVVIQVSARVSGSLGFENTTPQSVTVGGYAGGNNLGVIVPIQLPAGITPAPNPTFIPPQTVLGPYDGTTDQAGTSGITHVFTNETGDGAPSTEGGVWADAEVQAFLGTGNVTITFGPTLQQGPNVPPGVVAATSIAADVNYTVRYDFDAYPTAICRATVLSGCPCGNHSNQVRGCGNSVNASGGALTATGNASISNDTLVLVGNGMTPSSSALYFQGTSFQHAQFVYGDGLRCVTGNVVRLGTKTNAGGASSYPAGADPSVSVRGGVTAPGTRFYQVSYRDLGNYCTAAPFNMTSGVAIRWTL